MTPTLVNLIPVKAQPLHSQLPQLSVCKYEQVCLSHVEHKRNTRAALLRQDWDVFITMLCWYLLGWMKENIIIIMIIILRLGLFQVKFDWVCNLMLKIWLWVLQRINKMRNRRKKNLKKKKPDLAKKPEIELTHISYGIYIIYYDTYIVISYVVVGRK